MLVFHLGWVPQTELTLYPSTSFNMHCEANPSWLTTDFAKRVINGIDNSEVLGNRVIDSPVLGLISPRELSTGTKSVLLAGLSEKHSARLFDGARMGDNCYPWIVEAAQIAPWDIRVKVGRLLFVPWEGDDPILIKPVGEDYKSAGNIKGDIVRGYRECQEYLALHNDFMCYHY